MSDPKPDPTRYTPRPDLTPPPAANGGTLYHSVNGVPAITQNGVVHVMTPAAQAKAKANQSNNGYGWKYDPK